MMGFTLSFIEILNKLYSILEERLLPMGKRIDYYHGGRGSIFEYNTTLSVESGFVVDGGIFEKTSLE